MPKTITLRLDEKLYRRFRALAKSDNRSISNFIETAALRYVEQSEYVSELEMAGIKKDDDLSRSIKRGLKDAREGRGEFR